MTWVFFSMAIEASSAHVLRDKFEGHQAPQHRHVKNEMIFLYLNSPALVLSRNGKWESPNRFVFLDPKPQKPILIHHDVYLQRATYPGNEVATSFDFVQSFPHNTFKLYIFSKRVYKFYSSLLISSSLHHWTVSDKFSLWRLIPILQNSPCCGFILLCFSIKLSPIFNL